MCVSECVSVSVCVGGGNCAGVALSTVQTCVSKVVDKLVGCVYVIIA